MEDDTKKKAERDEKKKAIGLYKRIYDSLFNAWNVALELPKDYIMKNEQLFGQSGKLKALYDEVNALLNLTPEEGTEPDFDALGENGDLEEIQEPVEGEGYELSNDQGASSEGLEEFEV
jgi:hypothetical protein